MESSARRLPWHGTRAPQAGPSAAPRRADALWLAIYLPWLAGEVVSRDPERPLVISEESRRGWLVYRASPGARARGVCPGMTVSAAAVLCPGLATRQRQRRREQQRLETIGDWMMAFSPVVSIQPPETVLLEVRGSLNLFGGLERLRARITEQLEAAGHIHRIAGAPVPLAAQCLAHWGRDVIVEEKTALRSVLGAMPAGLLEPDEKILKRLERAGAHTLRDLWRLPVEGLSRRFGAALARKLSRLRGAHPDPRPLHAPPPYFYSVLPLDWTTEDLAQINRGLEYLLREWTDYLRRAGRGTTGFSIECRPERGGRETRVDVGVRQATADLTHLRRLAVERLSRMRLEGPVVELALRSNRIHSLPGCNGELFETGLFKTDQEAALQWRQCEELLATRLDGRGLETLYPVAEHRPELAWSRTLGEPLGTLPGKTLPGPARPLWLLEPPRPCARPGGFRRDGRGPGLVKGPERIETGWWDQHDQRRDYYVAVDQRGRRLWVFRDLKQRQWYLHGLFA